MSSVIEWINEKIINESAQGINPSDIDEIRDFALLWNLFESLCCNKRANMNKINSLIDTKIDFFEEQDFREVFEYFYHRYKGNNSKFQALNLKNGDKKLVGNILNDEYHDKSNKLKFILTIIYRYRNNLFHGEKDMRYIRLQKENFKRTNDFLMYFIETCKEN